MKRLKLLAITLLALHLSAHGSETKAQDTESSVNGSAQIKLSIPERSFSFQSIDAKKSNLQFYTADSDMKHDADISIRSEDGKQRLSIVIDGFDAKGKDAIQGKTSLESNNSLIVLKSGETEVRFVQGEMRVDNVEKSSGTIILSAKGLATVRHGKSYTDMKVDVPTEISVNLQLQNVRTVNYKKPN